MLAVGLSATNPFPVFGLKKEKGREKPPAFMNRLPRSDHYRSMVITFPWAFQSC